MTDYGASAGALMYARGARTSTERPARPSGPSQPETGEVYRGTEVQRTAVGCRGDVRGVGEAGDGKVIWSGER